MGYDPQKNYDVVKIPDDHPHRSTLWDLQHKVIVFRDHSGLETDVARRSLSIDVWRAVQNGVYMTHIAKYCDVSMDAVRDWRDNGKVLIS